MRIEALNQYSKRCESWNQKAGEDFEEVFETTKHFLLPYCSWLTGNMKDGEDLFQDVWLKAWKNQSAYEEMGRGVVWFERMAKRLAIDASRSAETHLRNKTYPLDNYGYQRDNFSVEAVVDGNIMQDNLDSAVKTLKDDYRVVWVLHQQGFSNEEIAELAGITVNAVRVRFSRAKAELVAKIV